MNRTKMAVYSLAAAAVLAVPSFAMADTISPDTFSKTLAVGDSYTLRKTVTIQAGSPTAAKVDVLFLFDTTGSMGSLISSAKTNATNITNSLSSFGSVSYGVSDYRDFNYGSFGGAGDYAYSSKLPVPGTATQAKDAINSLTIGWGNDTPESQYYALQQAASTTAWNADSNRFIVWFGDSPGHTSADGGPYATNNVTVPNTQAALLANNVKVEAIDLYDLNSGGTANSLAEATGGDLYTLTNVANITDVIKNAISSSFNTYSQVSLGIAGEHTGVGVSIDPVSYTGAFDRSTDRTFTFDVKFTGVSAGVFDFDINALVNSGITATEHDIITVKDTPTATPEPSTFVLFGAGLAGVGLLRRRMKK